MPALQPLERLRCFARILYQGVVGYRTKPPRDLGKNMLTEKQPRDLLRESGFELSSSETIKDPSRPSNIPVEYVKARKL